MGAGVPSLAIVSGSANVALASSIVRELGASLARCQVERFPDGEIHVEVEPEDVNGRDVVVVQSTSKDAGDHLLELLFLADACRRAGAASVSAAIPYFGYARHDRRKRPGEPLGARVVADVLGTAHFDRVLAIDLHSDVVEASIAAPVEHLSAVPLVADALRKHVTRDAVVVAPDLGGVRLAREYARILELPLAVVHKVRRSATHVDVERVAGEVSGRRAIIVDDMIATGGTIIAAAHAVSGEGALHEVVVAATHAVFAPQTVGRFREVGLEQLVVTNTVPLAAADHSVTVVSVAPLLAARLRSHFPGIVLGDP